MNNITYLDETNDKINEDILQRKEYQLFSPNNERTEFIPSFLIKNAIEKGDYLELRSYQFFVKNYLNPNTPYSRLLIKWETGIGKTSGALAIALNFIQFYQKQEEFITDNTSLGSIFILGFTQQIFRNELFKFPEFGFISREELLKLNTIKKNAFSGSNQDIEHLKKFNTMLKKRLHNRRGNGFFKFMGYKELTNHLFISKKGTNLQNLTDEELQKMISDGKIIINMDLMNTFANSLLICDEVHNIYNSLEKNNWGVAIQTILNFHKSCRALFLTATPINNSPTEIIDLLNLLLPRQHYPELKKEDFFDKNDNLLKEKEHKLAEYFKGRVSYVRNRNPQYMASKSFIGEKIKGIDYLSFVRCPMSKFHYKTYKKTMEEKDTLAIDSVYLLDFLLPDPRVKNPYDNYGIYKSSDIREQLTSAPVKWRSAVGISYDLKKNHISGTLLQKDTLGIISTKYKKMIESLIENIRDKKGKTFIYHNNIAMSGVLFIQEVLYQNGIIGEFDSSVDSTLCSVCAKRRDEHLKEQLDVQTSIDTDHLYQPVKCVIIHSNIADKKIINHSLEKFNHINNVNGTKFMILIGSRIMKESHSLNSVRNLFVMSRPDNISILIQIIGRIVRLKSHDLLPNNQRSVKISIFTSSVPGLSELSYEEKKYKEKIDKYKVIQNIEKIMHESAIDMPFNYDMIWEKSDEDKEFGLTILPYKKREMKSLRLDQLNLSTFNVYHSKFEVEYIMFMIKKLYIEYAPAWKYNDLLKALRSPPFDVEINTKIISGDLFNIALNNLLFINSVNYANPTIKRMNDQLTQNNLFDKIRNPDDKIFMENSGIQYILTQYGEFYVLMPMKNGEILNNVESLYRSYEEVKPHLMPITKYLKYDSETYYNEKKIRFIKKWEVVSINNLELALCDFGIKFHQDFLEEIIEYIFNIWTDPKMTRGENHNFYIKMLYYYDIQKLIVWAHTVNENMKKFYSGFVVPVRTKFHDPLKEKEIKINKDETSGFVNLLISSINREDPYWISTGMVKEYENKLAITNALFDGIYKKSKVVKKINADLLPVGHFLVETPRFYIPKEGWRSDPSYSIVDKNVKENPIVVGYDARSKTGMSIKFKIRNPIQNIKQFRDTRMIEKGSVCSTKSKSYLINISKKLNIEIGSSNNIDSLCQQIRSKLIYNELKSRLSNNPQRFFYFVYENIY